MQDSEHELLTVEQLAHSFDVEATPRIDLSSYGLEDWVALAVFWFMGICVFLQFFTRYGLNASLSWTEEVASNALMLVVFLGSSMCVRTWRHIHVNLLYRYMSVGVARAFALGVDLFIIGFFAYMTYLVHRFVGIVADQRMVSIDIPRSLIFYGLLGAFVLMLLRAVQTFVADYRRGHSVLDRPEAFDNPSGA